MPRKTPRGVETPFAEAAHPTVPMTEEQLRRVTIGEPHRHDAPITLWEYDPTWPGLFSREERRIRTALGVRAIRVEHVGSTSVPDLAAKPIIDILLVVADSADESTYVPALEAEGYVLRIREPDWYQHRLVKGPDTDINLHVFSTGAREIDRMLAFRDLLRTNPDTRILYARAKRKLARRTWKYVQNYADAKSEIVERILASANPSSPPTSGRSATPARRLSTPDVDGPEGTRLTPYSSPTGVSRVGQRALDISFQIFQRLPR